VHKLQWTEDSGNVMSMWSSRWHFTNKSVTGAAYSIRSYSLSHSWTLWWRVGLRRLKHAVPSWGRGGSSAELQQRWRRTNRRRKSIPRSLSANSHTYYYRYTHHSRLKTFLFSKSFPLQPFLFFFRTYYVYSPYCVLLLLSISFLLFSFSPLVCFTLFSLVVGSVW